MANTSVHSDHTQSVTQGISLSTLRRKRGNVIGNITSFTRLLDQQQNSEQRDIRLVRAHLDGLTETWKRFDDIQFQIEEIDQTEVERRFEIQNTYYAIIARADQFLHAGQATPSAPRGSSDSPVTIASAPATIKLPELRLPTFDGTIEKWTSFYNAFSSSIDRNNDLTAVQKFDYLRSTLTGRAATCIESLSTTEANYADAIEILKNKFHCPRRTILLHCDAIRDFPKLISDTPDALGNLVDTTTQHLRALKNLGEPIASWNSHLVSTILSKIGPHTLWQWELTLADKSMPSYESLLEFLDKLANCTPKPTSTTGRTAEGSRGNKTDTPRRHAFVSAKNPACPICKGTHSIRDCNTFREKSVEDRFAAVTKAYLCSNCLKEGHTSTNCQGGTCRVCYRRHHTLLHSADNPQGARNFDSSSTPHAANSSTYRHQQNSSNAIYNSQSPASQ